MSSAPTPQDVRPTAESAGPGGSLRRAAARWLREPLLHFLVLGAALFAISRVLDPSASEPPTSRQVVLTLDDLRRLQIGFAAQWDRPPSGEEMVVLIENRIREEILYREALALGLDKEDTIVKRRMAQKMEFLAEDVSAAREPTTRELRAWFEANSQRFGLPGLVTFRHLYFSPDRRGARAHDDAGKALESLSGKRGNWPGAEALGDPFMFQDHMADRSPEELAREFGPGFARSVFGLEPGAWLGPVESGYGWHLIFVDSLTPGRVPAFEEVEPDVTTAWKADQHAEAWRKAYAEMRAKYDLVLPAPPDKVASEGGPAKENATP